MSVALAALGDYLTAWDFPISKIEDVCRQFIVSRKGQNPFHRIDMHGIDFWKTAIATGLWYALLTNIAHRILSMRPHSMALERAFSIMGWLNSPRRSNLSSNALITSTRLYAHFRELRTNSTKLNLQYSQEKVVESDIRQYEDADVAKHIDAVKSHSEESNDDYCTELLEKVDNLKAAFDNVQLRRLLMEEDQVKASETREELDSSRETNVGKMNITVL